MRAISEISSRIFYVRRHMFHSCIYFLWLVSFFNLVQFCISIFCITVNSLLRIFRFWKICDPGILWSASEARIWISIVTFSTFILRLYELKGGLNLLFPFPFFFSIKTLVSLVWSYTMTATWVNKVCSFCSSYLIIQI